MGPVSSQWLPSKEQKSGALYYFLMNCGADWLTALQLLMLVKLFELPKLRFLAPFAFGCTSPQTAFTNSCWRSTQSMVLQQNFLKVQEVGKEPPNKTMYKAL